MPPLSRYSTSLRPRAEGTTPPWKRYLFAAVVGCAGMISFDADALDKQLAVSGTPTVDIVVKPGASARVLAAANDLATKLGQITGGTFTVTTGDGSTGIAIGLGSDFTDPSWPYGGSFFNPTIATEKENYAIRSHTNGVFVGGATDAAVEFAISDLLYRLGYRLFFPGYHQTPGTPANPISLDWEIIPESPTLSVDVDVSESPSYKSRKIWYGYGDWSFNATATNAWNRYNRLGSGIEINAGHAFGSIVSRNAATFAANPDYMALVGGVRTPHTDGNAKFCLSNTALRSLIVTDTLNRFASNPSLQSVSLEPSDGGGWCECSACAAMGSRSDQLMTLANEAATAVDAVYPGQKYIGIYAYNEHAAPPSITVHPRVSPLVATEFTPGWATNTLMSGWGATGASIGVREYYGVNATDRDKPGSPKGSDVALVRDTIKRYHEDYGAIFMSAESSNSFAPIGLSHYLATRYLWNTGETVNHTALINDFLTKSFGPAATVMGEYFDLIDKANRPLVSADLVGRMYLKCQAGLALTSDPAIRRRIYNMALYARYVEMWLAFSTATEGARQTAFQELLKFTYRVRKLMIVHSYALWRDLPARNKASLTVPPECKFNMPASPSDPPNPWKVDVEHTPAEIDTIISNGIANNPLYAFTPVSFSRNLVPHTFSAGSVAYGSIGYLRYTPIYAYVWNETNGPKTFTFSGKHNMTYANSDLLFTLSTTGPDEVEKDEWVVPGSPVKDVAYTPFNLTTDAPGLHQIEIVGDSFTMVPSVTNKPFTFEVSTDRVTRFRARSHLYFYVPKGTTVVGGFSTNGVGSDTIRDSTGATVHTFATGPSFFAVPVPAGQDGKFWKLNNIASEKILMTVPPYVARHPNELMIPSEVVEADTP